MKSCRLESDTSEDFLQLVESDFGDVSIKAFAVNRKNEIPLRLVTKTRKPFPPIVKEISYTFRVANAGKDFLLNLLLREIIRRVEFLRKQSLGMSNTKEENEHFEAVLGVVRKDI